MLTKSKFDLTVMRSNLAETKASIVMERLDLELEKQKSVVDVAMAKKKLEQEVGATIKKYKASIDFTADMARAMGDF